MDSDERVDLVPGDARDGASSGGQPWLAAEPLGHLIAVGGSQASMQFAAGPSHQFTADITVGSLLGIDTGQSLAIGTLCEVARETSGDGGAIGRLDLLGEICCDDHGERYFQAGITAYPKLDSAVVAIGSDELRVIFDLANPNTVEIGRLRQNDAIAAYVNIDEIVQKHFAIVGSTGSGKSTALALDPAQDHRSARRSARPRHRRPQRIRPVFRRPRLRRRARQSETAVLAVQLRGDRRDRFRFAHAAPSARSACSRI